MIKLPLENLALKLTDSQGVNAQTGEDEKFSPTRVLDLHTADRVVYTTDTKISQRRLHKLTHLLLWAEQRTVVGKVVAAGVDYEGPDTPGIPEGFKVPAPWEDEPAKYWIALSDVQETDPEDWVATRYNDHKTLKKVFSLRPHVLYVSTKADLARANETNPQVDSV